MYATRINEHVCVWEDQEWNVEGTAWIVSIDYDDADGDSYSNTISTHKRKADAIDAGKILSEQKRLPLIYPR